MASYSPEIIEKKWQKVWDERKAFVVEAESAKPKCYVLEMFPYPSGKLHMGHVRNYTIGDVIARFWKAKGYNVLHPIGWDALGLPAENAARDKNIHPKEWTLSNIDNMKKQLLRLGFSYDFSREITTCLPEYYKHEQALFIEMLEAGLVYQKESVVNWDPVDQTVLANEQVENGRGWRSGALVERKKLKQWFFKITAFADELVSELKNLKGWPDKVRSMQEKWIGRSEGAELEFSLENSSDTIPVYTTTPEAIFGATFVAISAEHPLVSKLEQTSELKSFVEQCKLLGTSEESLEKAEKMGLDTGLKAIHPFDKSIRLPVYITNFVLMEYGKGAIFGCPAHDSRDFEFASKYSLPIKQVVVSKGPTPLKLGESYSLEDVMTEAGTVTGLSVSEARAHVIKEFEKKGIGRKKVNYRLRDWGVSRQRYWGCPIPIIHCKSCGAVPVPKNQLPVNLPEDVDFSKPGNPLDHHETWKHVSCPKCDSPAVRETDTFDTFMESSWYFLRFCAPHSASSIDADLSNYWMPVDYYIGGIEHAVLHLLYARFFTKALNKLGYIDAKEPFKRLLTQGMVLHKTYKDSQGKWLYPEEVNFTSEGTAFSTIDNSKVEVGRMEKMSKSKKNTVDPDAIVKEYGVDSVRMFLLSDSPVDRDLEWSQAGLDSVYKFLQRIYNVAKEVKDEGTVPSSDTKITVAIHKTIEKVGENISKYHLNKAIANMRELFNLIDEGMPASQKKEIVTTLVRLLNPFAPHITEELWHMLGNDTPLIETAWPEFDASLTKETEVQVAVQVNGKLRGTIPLKYNASEEEAKNSAFAINSVQKNIEGKEVKKIIYVPNKIVNIVAK